VNIPRGDWSDCHSDLAEGWGIESSTWRPQEAAAMILSESAIHPKVLGC
jgi:hypothetical protein